jgi:hypothetical protein
MIENMIDALTSPNWVVTTILGAVLGALLSAYGSLILYPIRRLKRDQYIGEWSEYHWTWKDGRKNLCRGRFTVKRGLLAPYSVEFDHLPQKTNGKTSTHSKDLRYKGRLRLEDGHVVFDFRGTTHTESITYRFPRWIPSSSDRIVGIWMSFDHTGTPSAGGAMLVRGDLTDLQAANFLNAHLTTSDGLLRICTQAASREKTGISKEK